jgi:hypothetical protein
MAGPSAVVPGGMLGACHKLFLFMSYEKENAP